MATISTTSPEREAARRLRESFRGTVLVDGDQMYGEARRLWNGEVVKRPAVIARCEDESDVAAAVAVAREHDLPLSVRGGGHDWAGRALRDGGLVIDLTSMRAVTVDPDAEIATAQGGATAGDVVAHAGQFGLAPVTGTVKAVGMAGLTLGGGYGPLCGKHGLGADNLLGARVVLADSRIVTADDAHDPDLLWALRGGGGSFGVVTSGRYRLHPLASVTAGLLLFGLEQAATVLRGYRELIAEAPDELTVMSGFLSGPDGRPLLLLFRAWSGEPAPGEREITRFEQLGNPVMTQVAPMPYSHALGAFDAQVVNGRHHAIRTRWLAELTDDAAAILIDAARSVSSSSSAIALHHLHGAAARVAPTATAFALRREHLLVEIIAAWEPGEAGESARHVSWADTVCEALAPAALPGGYPNLLGPDDVEQLVLAYGANTGRLRELKRRYDPDDVFASAICALPASP
jgi:hypothetical protein